MKIKDIQGSEIEVTNLNKAIKQCKLCRDSPFKINSEHTQGENYAYMLKQLEKIKKELTD